MAKVAKKLELAGYDDIFTTDAAKADNTLESVREIPLNELPRIQIAGHMKRLVQ